jgi:hypothetical protein
MKIAYLLTIPLFLTNQLNAQKKTSEADSCEAIVDRISYYWTLDSLGTTGFRLYSFELLLKCKIGIISESTMRKKLGKPNEEYSYGNKKYYCYYYFNGPRMPVELNLAVEVAYLTFEFNSNNSRLIQISEAFKEGSLNSIK